MRISAAIASALITAALTAQVNVGTNVLLTGAEDLRRIDSLALPIAGDAAITVEGSVRSEWAWANAVALDSTITLSLQPAVTSYRDGLLIRFLSPTSLAGNLYISVDGLDTLPLVRPDGMAPALGQLDTGRVAEVMQAAGRFILMNAPESGCPPGFLQVNANYCIEATHYPDNAGWIWAVDRCASRGGKLCSWGEFHNACMVVGAQMPDLFTNWEWIDDTSNHTHGANQVARTTCQGHRTTILTETCKVRCCYHLR